MRGALSALGTPLVLALCCICVLFYICLCVYVKFVIFEIDIFEAEHKIAFISFGFDVM